MRRAGRCTSSTASDHVCCVAAWRRNGRLGEQEALICQVSTRRWNVGFPTVHALFMRPGLREVGERWWFENSRAYLYYFFIVNDCQFVAGHADAWCRGIGQTAARFLCDAPFLIRRSSIFLFRESSCRCLFMKFFLWRVRFWLRMNAGGVLNTCKSNGIHQALLGGESGERVSNA